MTEPLQMNTESKAPSEDRTYVSLPSSITSCRAAVKKREREVEAGEELGEGGGRGGLGQKKLSR